MSQKKELINELKLVLKEENIEFDSPMKDHITFKVGGPADILVYPTNYEEVISIIKLCKKYESNYFILGNGSNLLVKDGGIRGVVVKFSKLNSIKVEEDRVIAQSGAKLCDVTSESLKSSLKGFEFACGIPGSIGGATTMNAGAYNGCMADVVESVLVVDKEGNLIKLSKEDLEFGYRQSVVMTHNYIVLETTLKLIRHNSEEIKTRIDDLTDKRNSKQPLEYASAGSTFKRPEGHFAGKLIQDAGLKGKSVGGAEVSTKHSGFIINKGNATAKDILDLIALVQKEVKEQFGVDLYPEVRIIGEDK
ncbi:UDP-N-acetylmuramate dehydrogenase [Clostridium senegalense]